MTELEYGEGACPFILRPEMTATAAERVPLNPTLLASLRKRLGDRLSTSAAVCAQHGKDESYHAAHAPDAVAFAHSTEEVAAIVALCAEHRTPVIAFGTGTSLEGHVAALKGGVCIDLSQMNRVVRVNAEDLDATVEAGVTRKQLNEYLRDTGLFFPIDPGADASLGGMAATRASGTNAVRYGTMRENVLALTVVLSDGKVIRTAQRARKSAAGYDLTRLFVGSEGTLGVITEVTVRLYGIPEAISAASCAFPTIADAVDTVILTIQSGVPVARIELLDEAQINAINKYSKLDHQVAPTLFFEFHGTEAGVAEQTDLVKAIAADMAATISAGQRRPRRARNCGRRGTTPITPRWLCGRARRAGRPMSACRSRGLPNASPRPSAIWQNRRFPRPWRATSETAISISFS